MTEQLVLAPAWWRRRWRRLIFPSVWLIYLAQTAHGIHERVSGPVEILGYVGIAVFGVCYVLAIPEGRSPRRDQFWLLYVLCIGIVAFESVLAHEDAFVMCIYLAVLSISGIGRFAVPIVVGLTAITGFLPPLIPSWHAGIDDDMLVTIPLVSLAMYGFFEIIQTNRDLAAARSEVARLAAENERTRIARDLHDLLGHSLTTITVKAGLARRLVARGETDRAVEEIGDVEGLSRRSLTDVRGAVSGYREISLAGELATAREVLRAARIIADLPNAIDAVTPELDELFGWVVREGVTNVVRHSRARRCEVVITGRSIEIRDDGPGTTANPGSGLAGLRERVAAVGGELQAGVVGTRGWVLRVDVPAQVESTTMAT